MFDLINHSNTQQSTQLRKPNLSDHLTRKKNFTFIVDKTFIRTPKRMRKAATGTIWALLTILHESRVSNPREVGLEPEKCPFKTHFPST